MRVMERLAARRDAASGDYVEFFGDRHNLAKVWKYDLIRGVALSAGQAGGCWNSRRRPIRARGLRLTGFGPGKDGRLKSCRCACCSGAGGFVLSAVGGAEGAAYVRLSNEEWATLGEAEKALAGGSVDAKERADAGLRH